MSKNITIVTWHSQGNFGTNLQAYALFNKIKRLGYNARILSSIPERFGIKEHLRSLLSLTGYYDYKKRKELDGDIRKKKGTIFSEENMDVIPRLFFKHQIKKVVSRTDVFVTGSDQIWNTHFYFNPNYFLSFAENKKRVAYASSIGTKDIKEEHKAEVAELLGKFSHIGIREESAVEALSRLTHRNDIIQVLDPTFLMNRAEWKELADRTQCGIDIPDNFMLVYLLGKNQWYNTHVDAVVKEKGIKNIIVIPSVEYSDFRYEGAVHYPECGTDEFIKLLFRASLVLTDSFHATALSINIGKDFVEFLRFKDEDVKSQNARIYDLLAHYNLMDHIYSTTHSRWTQSIDYTPVHALLEHDRNKSTDYLTTAIEA